MIESVFLEKAPSRILDQNSSRVSLYIWAMEEQNQLSFYFLFWKVDTAQNGATWHSRLSLAQQAFQITKQVSRLQWDFRSGVCLSRGESQQEYWGDGANMQRTVFRRYLSKMTWSEEAVTDWGDLSYLLLSQYNEQLRQLLRVSQLWTGLLTTRTLAAGERNKVGQAAT